eukprot:7119622-Prymnesium_polylepis.1
MAGAPPDRDADLEPTVPNTVVWLVSIGMLVTNFAVNYKGKPYMEALSANRGLSERGPPPLVPSLAPTRTPLAPPR